MKNIRISKGFILCVLIVISVPLSLYLMAHTGNKKDINAIKSYDCDVKVFKLNTDISISSNGEKVYSVSGNILRLLTDPLTLYDADGKVLATAGDEYHIVNQDTHWIITDSEEIKMVGNFNLLGESYDIYINDEKVAFAKFNNLNTYGTIVDNDGNIMADYSSRLFFKDYSIQITEHNIFSDAATNLIFASYYSDQAADSSNGSNGSSSN